MNQKISVKLQSLGKYTADEFIQKSSVDSEDRKDGETLRVTEINLLTPAAIKWQTVVGDEIHDHSTIIYLDFVNDQIFSFDGSQLDPATEAAIKHIVLNNKQPYLQPSVPIDKLNQCLSRSKESFNFEEMPNVPN